MITSTAHFSNNLSNNTRRTNINSAKCQNPIYNYSCLEIIKHKVILNSFRDELDVEVRESSIL